MPISGYLLTCALGYLLGSIPTGYLLAKAKGVDIRTVGSGNIGATNVFRYLGKPAGIAVLLIDAAKGFIAVTVIARILIPRVFHVHDETIREWLSICGGISAVLGHNYTCWLRFKGGKGIATSAGVLVALVPWSLLIILTIWILVFAFTRYVSLGSLCAAFALPFAAWATGESRLIIVFTAILGVLAIYKHKANIQRLLKGTESRIALRKPATPETSPSHSK